VRLDRFEKAEAKITAILQKLERESGQSIHDVNVRQRSGPERPDEGSSRYVDSVVIRIETSSQYMTSKEIQ